MPLSKKKTSSRKRKSSHTTRRSRKPKIKLNGNRVIMLCGIISLVCVALLVISVVVNSPRKQSAIAKKAPVSEEKNIPEKEVAPKNNTSAGSSNKNASGDSSASKQNESTKPAETNTKQDLPAKQNNTSSKSTESNTKQTTSPSKKTESNAKQNVTAKQTSKQSASAPAKNVVPPQTNSQNQQGPSPGTIPYDIPDAIKGATLVFIFDDAGQSVSKVKRYTSLPMPLTIAVLPQLAHSRECADAIRAAKKEVMLHQPMQAENLKINPGPGAITPDMSTFDIAELLKKNIAEVGPVAGLNNHEGSLITEDEIKIGTVLDVATEKNMYFVDSRTTAATKAPQAALERDMHIFERDVFLDDVVNKDEVLKQIYRALGIANKKGKAIIIGHVDKSADIIPNLLRDMYPYLQMKGYRFAVPSQLK